jgi:hypothetical protein
MLVDDVVIWRLSADSGYASCRASDGGEICAFGGLCAFPGERETFSPSVNGPLFAN